MYFKRVVIMKKSGRLLLWSCSGFIVVSSLLALVCGHIGPEDDEWVDPTDMLNYDPITKSMRKTAEVNKQTKNIESVHV